MNGTVKLYYIWKTFIYFYLNNVYIQIAYAHFCLIFVSCAGLFYLLVIVMVFFPTRMKKNPSLFHLKRNVLRKVFVSEIK